MDRNKLLETVFGAINIGICVTDEDYTYVMVNDAYCRVYGYPKSELIGRPFTIVLPEESKKEVFNRYEKILQGAPGIASREWKVLRKDGEMIDVLSSVTLFVDQSGKKYIVTSVQDITSSKRNKAHIEFLSNYNSLTNLPNRASFTSKLQDAMEEVAHTKKRVAMLYININRFKMVNDVYGYQFGDKVLHAFALRLKEIFLEGEVLGNLGTDKFGAFVGNILPNQNINILTDYIKKRMREPFRIGDQTVRLSCSIGISFYPNESGSTEELFKNSEEAMLKAKGRGRNHSYIFNSAMDESIQRRRTIETDLENAIAREELFLVYQPQLDLKTDRICGVEALIRWKHPTLGMIPPYEFIPIAEESGSIQRIGDWTLLQVCRQSAKWRKKGFNIAIALNISAYQLMKRDFAKRVLRIVERYHIKPDRLELELTEGSIIEEMDQNVSKISELRDKGVKFSIDDFGTGYSSLSYLKTLPLDKLKIDKSFVDDLVADRASASVAKTIIDMAHNLRFKVIAEGVETEAQKEFLKTNGCDEMQGYLFSKPVPPETIEALL
jgi:diguanylate cyclase (GGDEF)-like protein/PAS domain S-box-containing protein